MNDAGQQKTKHQRLKTAAVKKVTTAGKQLDGDKSRKIEAREYKVDTTNHRYSKPSTPFKQTTKDETRKLKVNVKKGR